LTNHVLDAINFANERDTWAETKDKFFQHTRSIDRIRDESFWKTFPELNRLQDLTE
jgi:hypothetical protein